MYLDHFGFHAPPFAITPDTELFFDGGERGHILEQLLAAIQGGEGIIKVVGEVGSGKTLLCRLLCRRLPQTTRVALLLNPGIPPEELIPALLREFRVAGSAEPGQSGQHHAFLEFLVSLKRQGEQAVILVEEAQSLPAPTLEALRLISNLETEQAKLVSIVLFGQPELDRNLRSGGTRQILERITTHLTLPALSLEDTILYLHNRVHASGYRGPQLFSSGAARCIHRASRGAIRQINLLAEKSLIHASRTGAHVIASQHVLQGISTCEFAPGILTWHRPALAACCLLSLLGGSMALHTSWARVDMPAVVQPVAPITPPALTTPPAPEVPLATVTPDPPRDPVAMALEPLPRTMLTLARTLAIVPEPRMLARVLPNVPEHRKHLKQLEPTGPTIPVTMASLFSQPMTYTGTERIKPFPPPRPVMREELLSPAPVLQPNDPMRDRVRAAHRWLESSNGIRYTIQLIHLRNDKGIQNIEKLLVTEESELTPRQLKIFRLRNQNLMVYLGDFNSETEAQEAIERLPQSLRSGNPLVQPMERVRTYVRDRTRPEGCLPGQENAACPPAA
ncbi:MAG: AAA family ATPase [Magnetococcales bacterium]|nr:AAA family ATPase [Magnetococcales bacterium]